MELISFFQRAVPPHLLRGESGEGGEGGEREREERRDSGGVPRREGERGAVIPSPAPSLLQTEVGVVFERLGVRMLRRTHPTRRGRDHSASPAQFIASIMFYR